MDYGCGNFKYKDIVTLKIAILKRTKGKGGFNRDFQVI